MFKKQNKIEFFSFDKSLNYAYPIEKVNNLKPLWVKQAAQELKNNIKDGNIKTASHLCSGIKNLMTTGYIVRVPFDVAFKTIGNDVDIAHMMPFTNIDPISYFLQDHVGNVLPMPPQTLKNAIKIETQWGVKMPKGWKLLMLPINYYEKQPFTCATGILDTSISNRINPILYWHNLDGEYVIKAGTPLCQLIPIHTDEIPDMEVRDITKKELEWERISRGYITNSWQKTCYTKLSNLYYQFFDEPKKCPFHFGKK